MLVCRKVVSQDSVSKLSIIIDSIQTDNSLDIHANATSFRQIKIINGCAQSQPACTCFKFNKENTKTKFGIIQH